MNEEAEFYIDVISFEGEEVVMTLGPYYSARQAERAERGLGYQLDHARFYSQMRKEAK